MEQQTAVKQLVNYMIENFHLTDESLIKFEEAKQMEREQKEEEYKRGWEESKSTAIKYVEEFTTRLQNETN